MESEYAARKIIDAIERDRRIAVITRLIPLLYHFVRLM